MQWGNEVSTVCPTSADGICFGPTQKTDKQRVARYPFCNYFSLHFLYPATHCKLSKKGILSYWQTAASVAETVYVQYVLHIIDKYQ